MKGMDTINAAVGVVICDDMCGAYSVSLCSLMLLVMLLMFPSSPLLLLLLISLSRLSVCSRTLCGVCVGSLVVYIILACFGCFVGVGNDPSLDPYK